MIKNAVKLIPVLITLSSISCGNNSFLLNLSDTESAVIFTSSIRNGDILDPELENIIDISMEYDESLVRPARLEISFLDSKGNEISEPRIIEGEDLNKRLPSLSVESPVEDLYSVLLRVFDEDGAQIKEETIKFFYSKEAYAIRGISAYPHTFSIGGEGLIIPYVDGSDRSWLRWSIEDEIIEEGFLGQYRKGLIWKAPEVEGVYGLSLELFPVEPSYSGNSTYPFTSPVHADIEIFVSETRTVDSEDLYPADSYSTLIHFKGIIEDEGVSSAEIVTFGSPSIQRLGDKFGYYLDGDSGFKINSNILPVSENILQPFSITFSYFMENSQKGKKFIGIYEDQVEFFSIATDFSGLLTARLFQSEGSVINISTMYPEDYGELTLSVVPGKDSVSFYWYGDGVLQSTGFFSYKPSVPAGEYTSLIGGSGSIECLFDEFGIFFRDEYLRNNIDDKIFERAVKRKHNSEKISTAYGFDGLYFNDIQAETFSVSKGSLDLQPDSKMQFLEADLDFSILSVDIEFEEFPDDVEIQIDIAMGKTIHIPVRKDLDGIYSTRSMLEFEFRIANEVLSVLQSGVLVSEYFLSENGSAVFSLMNNTNSSKARIVSLLARREERRIVEKKAVGNEI